MQSVLDGVSNDVFVAPSEPIIPLVNQNEVVPEEVKLSEPTVEVETPSLEIKQEEPNFSVQEQSVLLTPKPAPVTEMPILEPSPVPPVVLGEEKTKEDEPGIVANTISNSVEIPATPILPVEETVEKTPLVEPVRVEEPVIPSPTPVQSISTVIPPVMPLPTENNSAESVVTTPLESSPLQTVAIDEPKLFFDGSQETNLNKALDEVSEEKTLFTHEEGVESLREFGVDTPPVVDNASTQVETVEKPKVLTKSKGFANNKFFTVIAILFFIVACAFLGYEAFHYFQLVK